MPNIERAKHSFTPEQLPEKWIRERIYSEHRAGPCVSINLYHQVEGSKKGSLCSSFPVKVPADDAEAEAFIGNIVGEILAYASNDCEATGHTQKYVVRAVYGTEKIVHGRHVMRVSPMGEGDDEDSELDSEPRNGRGLVSQMMRHTEGMTRLMVNNNDAVVRQQAGIIQNMGSMFGTMMHQMTEFMSRMNEAEDRRASREKELRIEERKAEADRVLMGELKGILPIFANRLAGGKNIIPQEFTPRDRIMADLLNGLNDEKLGVLLSVLSPEQRVQLAELATSLRKSEGKTEPAATPTPEQKAAE